MEKLKHALDGTNEDYRVLAYVMMSTDNTSKILEEYSAKFPLDVIEHPINRGLGESSRDLLNGQSSLAKRVISLFVWIGMTPMNPNTFRISLRNSIRVTM